MPLQELCTALHGALVSMLGGAESDDVADVLRVSEEGRAIPKPLTPTNPKNPKKNPGEGGR